jgi:hypothetical protein
MSDLITPSSSDDQSYTRVVRTYEVLHKLFFGLGIFIILIIIWSLMVPFMISQWTTLLRNSHIEKKEQELLSGMQFVMHQYDTHPLIKLFIKQWNLVVDTDTIQTTNNLLTYKKFVLPKSISISATNTLQPLDYFTTTTLSGEYQSALEYYMKTIVLTPLIDNSNAVRQDMHFLQPDRGLFDYFGVNCISNSPIIDTYCDRAIDTMIKVLPIYDLKKDYIAVQTLASQLKPTSFAVPFCDAIKQYIFFSNDSSESIRSVMITCGSDYEAFYNEFSSFRSIQDQLDKQFINATVTASPLLNAYKLVSTQQFIYNEMNAGKFNEIRLRSYNKYVEELLRKPSSLQSFYFQNINRFNNTYLIPEITRTILKNKTLENKELKSVLDDLKTINEGDSILWYTGLSEILNSTMVWSGTIITSLIDNRSLLDIFRDSYNFENFTVSTVSSGSQSDHVKVWWSFRFYSSASIKGIVPADMELRYTDKFIVDSITIPWYPLLTDTLATVLKTQSLTIPALYSLLVTDAARLNTKPKSICENLQWKLWLVSCSPQQIVFTGKIATNTVTYTIKHTNGELISYTLSDSVLNTKAQADLWVPTTTSTSLLVFIDELLRYKPSTTVPSSQTTTPTVSSSKVIQIREDFSILWAEVWDINILWSYYSVKFSLSNINFLVAYDLDKQNILGWAIVIGDKTYAIRGFILSLKDAKSKDLILFKNDPKSYLLQKDPLTVKKVL